MQSMSIRRNLLGRAAALVFSLSLVCGLMGGKAAQAQSLLLPPAVAGTTHTNGHAKGHTKPHAKGGSSAAAPTFDPCTVYGSLQPPMHKQPQPHSRIHAEAHRRPQRGNPASIAPHRAPTPRSTHAQPAAAGKHHRLNAVQTLRRRQPQRRPPAARNPKPDFVPRRHLYWLN